MKRILSLLALTALGGCAVVPYDGAYYSADAYPYGPVYAAPPVYAPTYVGPPAYFGFGLNYRSGGGHFHPHPRPGFRGPHPGFRSGNPGWGRGWRGPQQR